MERSFATRPRSFSAGNSRKHQTLKQTASDPENRPAKRDSPDKKSPIGSGSMNGNRYKTELCRTYQENGTCKYGEKCQFAHGTHELRTLPRHPKYKTELCRTFHSSGYCPYGPRCHFVHKPEERRTVESNQMLNEVQAKEKWSPGDSSPPPSPFSDMSPPPTGGSTFIDRIVAEEEVFVYPSMDSNSLTDITQEDNLSDNAVSFEMQDYAKGRGVGSLSDSAWSLGSTNSLDEAVNYRVFGGINIPFFTLPATS